MMEMDGCILFLDCRLVIASSHPRMIKKAKHLRYPTDDLGLRRPDHATA